MQGGANDPQGAQLTCANRLKQRWSKVNRVGMQFFFVYFIIFKIKYKIKKNENQLKWVKFDTTSTNYLTTMTNTNEPSEEMNETNQTKDPNPELNEENPKSFKEENPKDELHRDLN